MIDPENPDVRCSVEWDEGAASERTALAWERTAVASLAVAALVLRAGIVEGLLGLAGPIVALLVLAAALEWRFGRRIYAERDVPAAHGAVAHDRAVMALGVVTLITAIGSGALALGS